LNNGSAGGASFQRQSSNPPTKTQKQPTESRQRENSIEGGKKTAAKKQSASNVVKLDSREEQKEVKAVSRTAKAVVDPSPQQQTEIVKHSANIKSELSDNQDSAKASEEPKSGQRPRSRPSDKHPIKRGNSSSSQNNNNLTHDSKKLEQTQDAVVGNNLVDESDEEGEEEYEPHFDDDEEDNAEANDQQQ